MDLTMNKYKLQKQERKPNRQKKRRKKLDIYRQS